MNTQIDYANMSEDEIVKSILEVKAQRDACNDTIKALEDELVFRNRELIEAGLSEKDDPFGVVHVGNLKFNQAKAVYWDQEKLAAIHADIVASDADPEEYMVVSYKVREAAFKNWPDPLQDAFIDARIVKRGKLSLVTGKEEKV